jgi:hypothetical protein
MTFYNIKGALDDYRVTKFTSDLNVESSYLISDTYDESGRRQLVCECPAGVRPSCRHRQMLPDLLPLVDTEWFWDFERKTVVDANGKEVPSGFTVVPEADPILSGLQEDQILMGFHNEPATEPEAESTPLRFNMDHSNSIGASPGATALEPAKANGWRRI